MFFEEFTWKFAYLDFEQFHVNGQVLKLPGQIFNLSVMSPHPEGGFSGRLILEAGGDTG